MSRDDALRALEWLCAFRQRQAGDRPFFLSQRVAGRALGCEGPVTAWKCFQDLEGTGLVVCVRRGRVTLGPHTKADRLASAWCYTGPGGLSRRRAAAWRRKLAGLSAEEVSECVVGR